MANTTYATLAAVVGRLVAGDEISERLRKVKSKAGGRIPWRTIQRWVAKGFVRKEGEGVEVRYFLTDAGLEQAKHARVQRWITSTQEAQKIRAENIRSAVEESRPRKQRGAKKAPVKSAAPATTAELPMSARPLPFSQGGPPGGW